LKKREAEKPSPNTTKKAKEARSMRHSPCFECMVDPKRWMRDINNRENPIQ
jgi:hypothetical protein